MRRSNTQYTEMCGFETRDSALSLTHLQERSSGFAENCESFHCTTNIAPNRMVQAIHHNYRHHWSLDGGLPAGRQMEVEPGYFERQCNQGFPMGYVGADGLAYIYNHVNVQIYFQPVVDGTYRIVRFMVQPLSIHHDFVGEEDYPLDSQRSLQLVEIRDPIDSCDPNRAPHLYHTNLSMVSDPNPRPQRASGRVLFTYDVIWTEAKFETWTSRWNVYLTKNHDYDQILIMSIKNSVSLLLILMASMAFLVSPTLRKWTNLPKHAATGGPATKTGEVTVRDWQAVSVDVFRPPTSSPMLVAVCCGTGAQLLFSTLFTVMSLYIGWLTPTQTGNLFLGALLRYVLCGSINGYVTACLLRMFRCAEMSCALALTSFGFPGIVVALLSVVKVKAAQSDSTASTSLFVPILMMLLMIGVAALLILLGAFIGYSHCAIDVPAATNTVPRPIPVEPWFYGHPFTMAAVGGITFGALYMELFFLMTSLWKEHYFCTFGFLLIVIIVTALNIATLAIAYSAFRLQREEYRWWWRSFLEGGSVALFAFAYAFNYFQQLPVYGFSSLVVYFGYMSVLSIGLFLMTGFLGLATSLWFYSTLYRMKHNNSRSAFHPRFEFFKKP